MKTKKEVDEDKKDRKKARRSPYGYPYPYAPAPNSEEGEEFDPWLNPYGIEGYPPYNGYPYGGYPYAGFGYSSRWPGAPYPPYNPFENPEEVYGEDVEPTDRPRFPPPPPPYPYGPYTGRSPFGFYPRQNTWEMGGFPLLTSSSASGRIPMKQQTYQTYQFVPVSQVSSPIVTETERMEFPPFDHQGVRYEYNYADGAYHATTVSESWPSTYPPSSIFQQQNLQPPKADWMSVMAQREAVTNQPSFQNVYNENHERQVPPKQERAQSSRYSQAESRPNYSDGDLTFRADKANP